MPLRGVPLLLLIIIPLCTAQSPVVCLGDAPTPSSCIRGVERGTWGNTSYELFMGVPFARPPVGELRFANPVPPEPWAEVYDGTQPREPCIQVSNFVPIAPVIGSEDCLYLNVYRVKEVRGLLPVMVFLHAGGFDSGTASPLTYGPEKIMDAGRKVVLVTVQYRLGVFGFMSTGDSESPGNYGLKDQAMALRWVRKNIGRFGGDPDRITLVGSSAGAASAQLHMMSPLSRGLFSRVILMSGSALAYWATPDQNPMNNARLQVGALGISPVDTMTSADVVKVLRSASAEYLVESAWELKRTLGIENSVVVFRPVIEQYVEGESFMSNDPRAMWEEGNYQQVPMMFGQAQNEGIVFAGEAFRFMEDPDLWEQFTAASSYLIPRLIGLDGSKAAPLRDRFFGSYTRSEWLTPETINRLADMIGEAGFAYPALRTIRTHLRTADTSIAPVSMYQFNFRGPYSLSYYYLNYNQKNVGASHSDDAFLYLFSAPILFPEVRPGSPAWSVSQRFVNLITDFVHGISTPTCQTLNNCTKITISNSATPEHPFTTAITNASQPELMAFWDSMYHVQ
ncbi:hypothetical protein pipiens_019660 [Culex pipiens pipiens]|uniref:Carboxylic ester hydrolase n=1 Tax=Culex pipiens pipiens TaxID=38569 RepID=A0ABD1DUB5_CULPP